MFWRSRITIVLATVVSLAASPLIWNPASAAPARETARLSIEPVSNPRPGLVSGGEILLRVTVPHVVRLSQVQVTLGSVNVTSDFAGQPDGTLLGLVTGLRNGPNLIRARAVGDPDQATLQVRNHPITGPVFSGPQQEPFYCQTTAFGLAPSVPPLCSAPTQVTYLYKSTSATGPFDPAYGAPWKDLASPSARPADLAHATVSGRSVPYIVRLEQGTIDRAVYQIAALWDGRDPSPLRPGTGWNHRLIYTFGGGCDAGYRQGSSTGGVISDLFLSQGYAVASSSLNVLDNNCSPVISAEAAMMVKEHFIDTYGPVQFTIGWGGSGGAIQQYDIADEYPGILNGIIPAASFPDAVGTTLDVVGDCRLLDNYFGSSGNGFTPVQMTAVAGFGYYSSCPSWDSSFANRLQATASCQAPIPVAVEWNPVTNPAGIKCSAATQLATQLGVNPKTGFVHSVTDNVGVQYGLKALLSKTITPGQFVSLNKGIGGYDIAGNPVPQRSEASPQALRAMYADDLMPSDGLGLRTTAIIDQRVDLDPDPGLNIHTAQWSYVIRQRMKEQGDAANQVIIESDPSNTVQYSYELSEMAQWLGNVSADSSHRSLEAKVAQDKPAGLGDGCFLADSAPPTLEPLSYHGTGPCPAAFPIYSDPRLVAGTPLDEYTLKCSLKPLSRSDYPGITFTSAQWAELRATFPAGACDYSKPGIGEQAPRGTWLNYGT